MQTVQKIDYRALQQELVRAVRGHRSQERISREMGFKSNPVYRWETGSVTVHWDQFVELCRASRRDLPRAVHYVLGFAGDPTDVGSLLRYLAGSERIVGIAKKTGHSRFTVAKWLSGKSTPNLEVILRILDELQFILVEFVEALVPASGLPSLHAAANQLKLQKEAIYSAPEIEAILCCLALDAYRELPRHQPGFVAERAGITLEQEKQGLQTLKAVGLVTEIDGKFTGRVSQVDTQGNFAGSVGIRSYWGRRYLEFLDRISPPEGKSSKTAYFLVDLSDEGEKRALKAYHEFCFKIRAIAKTDSGRKKTVKLCAAQVLDLRGLASRVGARPDRLDHESAWCAPAPVAAPASATGGANPCERRHPYVP